MDKQNLEFIRLLENSGWTQAKTAEELGLTTGAISQFVGGSSRPKSTVLRLFRLLVGDVSAVAPNKTLPKADRELLPLDGAELELLRDLRSVEDSARKKLVDQFRGMLQNIPARPARGRK